MQPQAAAGDEVSVARTIRNGLPELPPLPNLGGLSRQDKDDVRRIRSDYANIVRSLDGILAGEPPTGDTREDLRRVRNELEYVSGRLNEHLLPGSDQAQDVRRKLFDLREQLDQAVNALPERAPQPQGDGPNGARSTTRGTSQTATWCALTPRTRPTGNAASPRTTGPTEATPPRRPASRAARW